MYKLLILSTVFLSLGQEQAENSSTGTDKPSVLVVYYSKTGNTKEMAESVVKGVRSVPGVVVVLRTVAEAKEADVLAADAIILGSPVYNANVAPPVQEFINSWPFQGSPLADKLGAAFVTAGGLSAGEEFAQLSLLRSMLVFNMIVVGGPGWRQAFGASAVVSENPYYKQIESKKGGVEEYYLKKGEALGKRVAELARKLKK